MKQILNMLRLDKALIIKEKIAVYIIIIPVLMSFLILMVLTAVENDNIRIAVTADVPEDIIRQLERHADIVTVHNLELLKKRVNEFDNIAGAYMNGENLQVLFQGNEGSVFETSIQTMVNGAVNTDLPAFTMINVSNNRDFITQMIISVLLTATTAIGGIVSGFNIVTEKETLMSRAYRISPISTSRYLISHYIVSVIVGLINLIGISLILGVGTKLPMILLVTLFALPLFISSPILIGGIAKDKMGCISMIKVIMLIFICLPIGAALTPEAYQFFFYPFPMFWHYKMIESVLQGNFNLMYGIITFLISGVILAILSCTLGKRLQKA